MAFDSPAGFLPIFFGVGPVELAQVPPVNMGFMPNKGNAKLEGDIVIEAGENGEGGYVTADCLEIGPADYTYPYAIKTHEGHVGIGTSNSTSGGSKIKC